MGWTSTPVLTCSRVTLFSRVVQNWQDAGLRLL